MKFVGFGLALVIVSLADVSNARNGNRIVFGKYAKPKEFPWMLRYGNGNICGASLVKLSPNDTESDVALTAAHCFQRCSNPDKSCCFLPEPNTTYVRYGSVELNGGPMVRVERVHSYSDKRYAAGTQDIAVLKLTEKIQFSNVVTGVLLPDEDGAEPSSTDKCMLSGWGLTEKDKIPGLLKKTEFNILDPCDHMPKHPGRFCGRTAHDRTPACHGDSGSPGVCQRADGTWIQYGVLIQGRDRAHPNSKGCANVRTSTFTRVSDYLKWIREVADSDSATCP